MNRLRTLSAFLNDMADPTPVDRATAQYEAVMDALCGDILGSRQQAGFDRLDAMWAHGGGL